MTAYATYLINGVDLSTRATIIRLDGALGVPGYRGDNLSMPYHKGRIYEPKTVDQQDFALGIDVRDTDPATGLPGADPIAQFLENWRYVRSLFFDPDKVLTVQRTLVLPSGNQVATASCEVTPASLFPTMPGPNIAQAVVGLSNLDGYWYGASVAATSPGTVTVLGDKPTSRMTITFTGAATLADSTTGYSVTVTAATVLDTDVFTSTNGIGLVSAHVGGYHWMKLAPGNNVLTGAASISYQPAYL